MRGLYGRYEKSLDSKNRLIIPNTLRKKLEGEELVLVAWFDHCLALFPSSVFEGIADKINLIPVPSEKIRGTRRRFFGSAFNVEFDNQGRIGIPDYLLKFATMDGSRDVVLIGDYDKIEIWPKGRFEQFDEGDQVTVNEDYEQTLERVAELTQPGVSIKPITQSDSKGEGGNNQ